MKYEEMGHSELVAAADELLAIKDNPNADPTDRLAAEEEYNLLNQSAQALNLTDRQVVTGTLDLGISVSEIRRALGFMVRGADRLLVIIHGDAEPAIKAEAQREYDLLNARVREVTQGGASPRGLIRETKLKSDSSH